MFSRDTNGVEKGAEGQRGKVVTAAVVGTDVSAKQALKEKKKARRAFSFATDESSRCTIIWKGSFTTASMALKSVPAV